MIAVFTPNGFLLLIPLKAARDQQNFRFLYSGVQFDSIVNSTELESRLHADGIQTTESAHLNGMHTTEFVLVTLFP